MAVQSAVLKSFYINIQTWIDAGCPDHPVFAKNRALCISLMEFTYELGANKHMRHTLHMELLKQFEAAKLDVGFPFNNFGNNTLFSERQLSAHYENPKRLAWVKQHAQEEPHG